MRYFTHAFAFVVLGLVAVGCASATRFDSISVRGSENFRREVSNSLTLLKTKSPSFYATITNNVAVVRTGARVEIEIHTDAKPARLLLPASVPTDSTIWRAGVIAHFAYHSHLYRQFLLDHAGIQCVPYNEFRWRDAEKRCLEFQLGALRDLGAPAGEFARAQSEPHTIENTNPTHP